MFSVQTLERIILVDSKLHQTKDLHGSSASWKIGETNISTQCYAPMLRERNERSIHNVTSVFEG